MSKTNDTSNVVAVKDHRPLADSELDTVAGGANGGNVVAGWDMKNGSGPIGPTIGPDGNPGPAIDAWNKCLGVFGY